MSAMHDVQCTMGMPNMCTDTHTTSFRLGGPSAKMNRGCVGGKTTTASTLALPGSAPLQAATRPPKIVCRFLSACLMPAAAQPFSNVGIHFRIEAAPACGAARAPPPTVAPDAPGKTGMYLCMRTQRHPRMHAPDGGWARRARRPLCQPALSGGRVAVEGLVMPVGRARCARRRARTRV